jgi:hypothetical protein
MTICYESQLMDEVNVYPEFLVPNSENNQIANVCNQTHPGAKFPRGMNFALQTFEGINKTDISGIDKNKLPDKTMWTFFRLTTSFTNKE